MACPFVELLFSFQVSRTNVEDKGNAKNSGILLHAGGSQKVVFAWDKTVQLIAALKVII